MYNPAPYCCGSRPGSRPSCESVPMTRPRCTCNVQIASALSHLHASRPTIIHRDIKQENLLLKKDPAQGGRLVAKLGDLGLHVVG